MANFKKKLIQDSKDYDNLHLLSFNRPAGVRKDLEESIRTNGFTDEIKVVKTSAIDGKSKLYIVDGQNRYFTARSMNHTFDYIIEKETEDLDEIAAMVVTYNTNQKPWTLDNYVNLHIHFQNQNYITLKRLSLKYGCSIKTVAVLLAGFTHTGGVSPKDIKGGNFVITSLSKTIEILNEISEIKKIVPVTNRFTMGFAAFYSMSKSYNSSKFLKMIENHRDLIKKCRDSADFKNLFNKLSI